MKLVFKILGFVSLGIFLVVAGSIAYFYLTYIDETIISGTAYGFSIGQTKGEAYKQLQNMFEAGEISSMDTIKTREVENSLYPDIGTSKTLDEIAGIFQEWDSWVISSYSKGGLNLMEIRFHGESVNEIRTFEDQWRREETGLGRLLLSKISVGQSRQEAFEALKTISDNINNNRLFFRSGWMARRQPVLFLPDEYYLVAKHDSWEVYIGECCFNNIELTFQNEALVKIHRHRQEFELP